MKTPVFAFMWTVISICNLAATVGDDKKTGSQTSTQTVAEDYIKLYTTVQIDEYAKYFTDATVFEDATTSFFREDKSHFKFTGKDSVVKGLKDGFKGIFDGNFDVQNKFFSGEFAVFQGIYHYKTKGDRLGSEKPHIQFDLPLVTVLRIRDGKVIHHQDFADYATWMKQFEDGK